VASYYLSTLLSSNNNNDENNSSDESDSSQSLEVTTMEIVVKYGSTLHIRYPSPTTTTTTDNDSNNSNNNNKAGKVDVAIQRPILYSASASLVKKYDNDEKNMTRQQQQQQQVNYILCNTPNYDDTTSSCRHRLDKERVSMTPTTTYPHDDSSHIIITIAAGKDEHYWFVTFVSMALAFIGGLWVLVSLDSISIW
jgi:hypothetical protein